MNKKVLLLGATGQVGRIIYEQLAPLKEIQLTGLVRNPAKISQDFPQVEIVTGDILDQNALQKAMLGQDFVVASLNQNILEMAQAIVEAARDVNAQPKIIWLTGRGIHREIPGAEGAMLDQYLQKFPEFAEAADTIADSGFNYTLIRAPKIIDGETNSYHLTHEGAPVFKDTITKKAIAQFIVDTIINPQAQTDFASLGIEDVD